MHQTVGDRVVQTEWLFTQVTDVNELDLHGPLPLNSGIADAKRGDITLEEAYEQIKDIVWPWTIQRRGETKDSNRDPLVRIPGLVQHDVRLQYTDAEVSAIDDWILDARNDKWNAIQTVLDEWRLACLTMHLPDNDVSSDDSSAVDRGLGVSYREMWDCERFCGGPALRWLSGGFVPQLLGTPGYRTRW